MYTKQANSERMHGTSEARKQSIDSLAICGPGPSVHSESLRTHPFHLCVHVPRLSRSFVSYVGSRLGCSRLPESGFP